MAKSCSKNQCCTGVSGTAPTGIVYRKLPHSLTQSGALHGATEALEEVAAMGLGGVPPVFADKESDENRVLKIDRQRHKRIDRERSA